MVVFEIVAAAALWALQGAQPPATTAAFDKNDADKTPTGWTATQTGTGAAKWTVVRDDTAPGGPYVLKQSGQATFPVCLKDGTDLRDGFVEVKFKPIAGKEGDRKVRFEASAGR